MRSLRFGLLVLMALGLSAGGMMQAATILAVFAHPDDETTVGPLLARYAAEGHRVFLLTLTLGQKGVTPHARIPAGEELGRVRAEELKCACSKLGIEPPILPGFQDQHLSQPQVMVKALEVLKQVIEEKKPDVVITWGPDGVTGHPDHRATSNLVTEVLQAASKLTWKPRKLYYVAFPSSVFNAAVGPGGSRFRTVDDQWVTTLVDCKSYVEKAAEAVRCHRSQWTPEVMESIIKIYAEVAHGKVYLRLALQPAGKRETGILDF